jgi:hypothetical protein
MVDSWTFFTQLQEDSGEFDPWPNEATMKAARAACERLKNHEGLPFTDEDIMVTAEFILAEDHSPENRTYAPTEFEALDTKLRMKLLHESLQGSFERTWNRIHGRSA